MSSSISEILPPEGKLLVHIAENGHSFELDCDETTPVEAVMRFLESVSSINFNDQLVLCLDVKLEPQKQLSAYKLPSNDKEVYIFNKARLQNNSPPPPLEQVEILEVTDPPPPASSRDPHQLDDAPDPALKALPSYERQFRYHYQKGHAIYSRTQTKYENCERLLREQKVQERAVEVGRGNLEQYYRVINQNYVDFMKRYMQQFRIHSDLLANFGREIEKLRSIKLHPNLQTSIRKCLLDFVKEESLRKTYENCGSSHKQFENKVSQFKQMFSDVKRKVEELLNTRTSVLIKNMEAMIKEHQRYVNEQKSIMQSLRLVNPCLFPSLLCCLNYSGIVMIQLLGLVIPSYLMISWIDIWLLQFDFVHSMHFYGCQVCY